MTQKKPVFNLEKPAEVPQAPVPQIISLEDIKKRLKGKSLFVAIPAYGGMMTGFTTKSLNDLVILATKIGLSLSVRFIFNESLITRARNYLVDEFFRSEFTHMMFIDSDIFFSADDVIVLLAMAGETDVNSGKKMDIVGGLYPKKNLAADKMIAAVKSGLCSKTPDDIFKYGADLVVNLPPNVVAIDLSKPVEVSEFGTGFMMFSKEVVDKMRRKYPETKYLPDHARIEHFDGSRPIYALFDCIIDEESKRYLSEDYLFCKRARKIGLNCFIMPQIELGHIGSIMFKGSFIDIFNLHQKSGKEVNPSGPIKN